MGHWKHWTGSVIVAVSLGACGSQSAQSGAGATPTASAAKAADHECACKQVRVVPAPNTPIEGPAPTIALRAPSEGELVKGDVVNVDIALANWELSPTGNHVHLIVDNEPYIAIRDVSKPVNLGEVVEKNLAHPLSAGTHVLRLFPSRPNHESVKDGSPFVVRTFHYKEKTHPKLLDAKAPLLTYSRPKGCYPVGERILLDFYLVNAELGTPKAGSVEYAIDGKITGSIARWQPHYIERLGVGEHTVRLRLLDEKGQGVAGPFNDTTRSITVAQVCAK